MNMRLSNLSGLLVFTAVLTLTPTPSSAAVKTEVRKTALRRGVSVAPLPPSEKVGWSHAPFEGGDCGVCHERNDPKSPGPIRHSSVNEECYECHEDTREVMSRRYKHVPAVEACTDCHNPHNSTERGLLAQDMVPLCLSCHQGIKEQITKGAVKHKGAMEIDKKCSNCHNPHAANIEKLLIQLPFDLCVNCHSKDGMASADGKPMTNYKKWLADNKEWHAPVKAKDCSACHRTHAGDNFRLLVANYPSSFYAPYENKNYALCYGCHNAKVVTEPETTTLTGFRDGNKNLHYVHVHKERGRTCRACHEVHASKQDHHIRDGVPYGPKGWMLKINFTKLPTGGSCAKTCHETKAYNNKSLTAGQ